ncbi:MAG: HEAT repeat domain-containing protein [Planctomycetaceae bacterium]|nr:MAG: HEAT repeat domain-containing protein [Planctomycetaceae bacterium]
MNTGMTKPNSMAVIRNLPKSMFSPHALILASCLAIVGCWSGGYPESRFRPIEIPADAPAELMEKFQRLNSPQALTRAHAARQLGKVSEPHPAVITCLLAALKDENMMVRMAAAEGLGNAGDPRAIEPLIQRMRDRQEDREVRARAAESLGQLQADQAVDVLIKALNDSVWYIRLHAVQSLAAIGDPAAVPHLEIVARYDSDYSVRSAADQALQVVKVADQQKNEDDEDVHDGGISDS